MRQPKIGDSIIYRWMEDSTFPDNLIPPKEQDAQTFYVKGVVKGMPLSVGLVAFSIYHHDVCVVYTNGSGDYVYYIPFSMCEIAGGEKTECDCEITTLMISGCKCGAIK